ncbi:MAG: G-D-S-L family lipolytic protein [Salegentibacter sp.]
MKKYFNYIAIGAVALAAVSCEPDLSNPIDEQGYYSNGQADFSNYVALGNSLTAGYADGALYLTGQENSYPSILAHQFSLVQNTEEFTQPLVNDNAGGLLLGGNKIADTRYVLAVDANNNPYPARYGEQPTTEVTNKLEGPFNNMGVPGAKVYHLVAPGYGNVAGVAGGLANPYFARFATSDQTTVLADAMAENPTFFSLWIGNNDVLGYATSGGVGTDQANNTDPSTYGQNDITDPNVFAASYQAIVEGMISAGAEEGALINIPDVTTVPYFTTVPNNALDLTAEQAGQLTGYFQAVAGVFTQVLMQQGIPAEQAQAIAGQYKLTFNEGPNRFIIDVPKTQTNPLGFRQMTAEELLVLTINQSALAQQGYGSVAITPEVMQVLGVLQQGGQPTEEQVGLLFDAVNGIDDGDVLDTEELQHIEAATTAYNQTIAAIADAKGLALVDANAMLKQLANGGISYDGGNINATFVTGGAFSLDGVHLTPRGYAVFANELIKQINATYNSDVPKVNPGDYATVTLNNNVQ